MLGSEMEKIEQSSGKLEQEVVNCFLDRFFSAYHRVAKLKKIFNYYGFYRPSKDKHPIKLDKGKPFNTGRFAIRKVENKEYFLHVNSFPPAFGSYEAQNLAWNEEFYIFLRLKNKSETVKKEQIIKILNNFKYPNEYIVLTSGSEALEVLGKNLIRVKNELNEIGYYGNLSIREFQVPVFKLRAFRVQDFIIVLNRDNMGQIIQYPPNDPEKGESDKLVRDEFYTYIEAPSNNEQLMQKLLDESPEWLQRLIYKERQVEYLSDQVFVEIRERFHYFDDTTVISYLAEWM